MRVPWLIWGLLGAMVFCGLGIWAGRIIERENRKLNTCDCEMPYAADTPKEVKEEDEPWLIVPCFHRIFMENFTYRYIQHPLPPIGSNYIYKRKWWVVTDHYWGERGKWFRIEKKVGDKKEDK